MLDFLKSGLKLDSRSLENLTMAAAEAEHYRIQPVLDHFDQAQQVGAAQARRAWRELVRYLIIVGHLCDRDYGMYGPVDELWHHFVLHTELYQDFCDTHAGGFVHHHPGSTLRGAAWRARYLQFLIDYQVIFGEAPPDDLWPLPGVSKVKLPTSASGLRQRHVKAMARLEAGQLSPRRGMLGTAVGCGGGIGVGDSGDGGCSGGGCGGGGCGGGGGD